MGETCSCPGCVKAAKHAVIAEDAGDMTGNTFYTCEKHGLESDNRTPI